LFLKSSRAWTTSKVAGTQSLQLPIEAQVPCLN
jgi:hypothetical protein